MQNSDVNDRDLVLEISECFSEAIAKLVLANEQPDKKLELIDEAYFGLRCLISYCGHVNLPPAISSAISHVSRDVKLMWRQEFNVESCNNRQPEVDISKPGRPAFVIPEEQILYFLESGFNVNQISQIFGVSVRTVRNRMSDYNISVRGMYSNISDSDLDAAVQTAWSVNPNFGAMLMRGALRSRRILVTHFRLRECMQRLRGQNSVRPCIRTITRRQYNVSAPLALFHIDGHHKLIRLCVHSRWRLVTHGGCDGYSRLAVYLRCSDNNRADTVLDCFKEAVARYGLPECVRSDKGVENGQVCLFMLNHAQRGPDRAAFITGKSTHNQRIERLWKDVFASCVSSFQNLFWGLEYEGYLDPLDELDMWCLHRVFLPSINHSLTAFKDAWNDHRIRTEGLSPHQMFISGLENVRHGSTRLSREFFDEDTYGIDWQGPIPDPEDEDAVVVVPETTCPISLEQLQRLDAGMAVPDDQNDLGRQRYINTRRIVRSFAHS